MGSSWKAAFGILLVFILGCVSGSLSTSVYFHQYPERLLLRSPAATADSVENRLTRHLDLDANQRTQIHQFLMAYLQDRKKLQTRLQPDIQDLNIQMVVQIRSVLHPDQMESFHQNVIEFRRRVAKAAFRPGAMEEMSDGSFLTNAPVGLPPATNAAGTPAGSQ
jgi:hypothetical protein